MRTKPTAILIAGLIFQLWAMPAGFATAAESRAKPWLETARLRNEAAAKINLSGRERMLAEQLANTLCMKHNQVAAAHGGVDIQHTIHQIEAVQSGLVHGNANLRLPPERSPAILAAMKSSAATWQHYHDLVVAELTEPSETGLRNVYAATTRLQADFDASFAAFEAHYANSKGLPADLAATLHLAGSQEMLSQKASFLACYLGSGLGTAADVRALLETVGQFETTLATLRRGDAARQVLKPPMWEIDAALELVDHRWNRVAPILRNAAVVKPDAAALSDILNGTNAVLEELEEAMQLYQML